MLCKYVVYRNGTLETYGPVGFILCGINDKSIYWQSSRYDNRKFWPDFVINVAEVILFFYSLSTYWSDNQKRLHH